jgi:hypothetical protein
MLSAGILENGERWLIGVQNVMLVSVVTLNTIFVNEITING